jgi:hypothetical protein
VAAHETYEEFAILLSSSDFRNTRLYHIWAPLFPFVHGRTVEEVVASHRNDPEELADGLWLSVLFCFINIIRLACVLCV